MFQAVNVHFLITEHVKTFISHHILPSNHLALLRFDLTHEVGVLLFFLSGGKWITPAVQIPKSRVDIRPLARSAVVLPVAAEQKESGHIAQSSVASPPANNSTTSSVNTSSGASSVNGVALPRVSNVHSRRGFRRRWAVEKPPKRKKPVVAPESTNAHINQ